MPNWCVNRIKISGKPETIQKIVEDIQRSNDVILLQERAIKAAIKLFLCAEHELIERFKGSKGGVTFKCLLNNHEPLTVDVCEQIIDIYAKSGVGDIEWNDISMLKQPKIAEIFEKQAFDWFSCFNPKKVNYSTFWAQLSPNNVNSEALKHNPFESSEHDEFKWNFHSIIPLPVDVAINGFNGKLNPAISSGYDWNVNNLGAKWSVVEAVPIDLTEDYLCIEFDTAWSPVCDVSQMLSAHYQCEVEHIYAEQGMGFCGHYTFVNGELIDELYGDRLVFSEDDDSGWPNVIGPDYIMELGHFGG